jgi:transcriptional regulator with XRE-family HTH domain
MRQANLYSEFGALVRRNRYRLKLSQATLADRVGLTRTSITNIESGRQKILLHHLFLLADALGISPQALLPSLEPGSRTEQIEKSLPKHLSFNDRDLILRMIHSNEGRR